MNYVDFVLIFCIDNFHLEIVQQVNEKSNSLIQKNIVKTKLIWLMYSPLYWLTIQIMLNMMKALHNWIALEKGMAKTRKRNTFWKQSFDNVL